MRFVPEGDPDVPYTSAVDESVLYVHVGTLCKSPVIYCTPETGLVDAARLMQMHDITGLVVAENEIPVGIFSIRDFRRLVAESNGDLVGLSVRNGMTSSLITVKDHDCVLDAIFKMARHNIHRLGVVDIDGSLIGLITDTDLLSLQTKTPLYINNEIDAAQTIEQLRAVSSKMLDTVILATKTGADIKGLVQLISHFNDAMTHRLIYLLGHEEGITLPEGVTYLVLGSEGRGEQTLRTDQDSAIVYADDLPHDKYQQMERFALRIVEALESLGVPRCPGNTMASNPQWCHSLSEWQQMIDEWITVPTPEHMVSFGMFQDLRAVHGDPSLEGQLHEHILSRVNRNTMFMVFVAKNIMRFPPPLGLFSRFRVEKKGENRGKIDLKKAGIFAVTEGASLLALEIGVFKGTTWDKLELLGRQGIISPGDLETVEESFSYLVSLRLQRQLQSLAAGNKPSNSVDPLILTDKGRDQLRTALKGVDTFLNVISNHFQLNFIS
jgi:CBS domain-containing protein